METTIEAPSHLNPLSISNNHHDIDDEDEDENVPLTSLNPIYDDDDDDDVLLPPPSWIFDCFEQQRHQSGIPDRGEEKELETSDIFDDDDVDEQFNMKQDEIQPKEYLSKAPTKNEVQKKSTTATTSTISTVSTSESASSLSSFSNSAISNNQSGPKTVSTPIDSSSIISSYTHPTSIEEAQPRSTATWKETIHNEISTTLPMAARELVQTSLRTIVYKARISYAARGLRYHRNSDLGNSSGYIRPSENTNDNSRGGNVYEQNVDLHTILEEQDDLPAFSSLSWVDRQLVSEWRTLPTKTPSHYSFMKQEQKPPFQPQMHMTESFTDTAVADADYELARLLIPKPISRPVRAMSDRCQTCQKSFSRIRNRHHCRLCGGSFCQEHSNCSHLLPHLDYDPNVPERVCEGCKAKLVERDLAERVAWRMARCRDFLSGTLAPYFETGVDTVEDAAIRIARATIRMAKQIPLGAQATVAVETVDVLRKHGLKGVYGIVLRKEFLAAADLLCKVTGINKRSWPLSVHELSAAIFYALAQHRAIRGNDPEREQWLHTLKENTSIYSMSSVKSDVVVHLTEEKKEERIAIDAAKENCKSDEESHSLSNSKVHHEDIVDENDVYNPMEQSYADLLLMADLAIKSKQSPKIETQSNVKHSISDFKTNNESESKHSSIPTTSQSASSSHPSSDNSNSTEYKRPNKPKNPVCEPVSDSLLSSLLFYAPIAMNFIYCTNAVDMQLLAAQQNWHLLYAHLEQDATLSDRPASALFIHKHQKIACFAVRGTATINDVVTDIRAMPVPFPDTPEPTSYGQQTSHVGMDADWMPVDRGQGLALCGMARSAGHLFRENMDTLVMLVEKGYRIRITGHSLGGGVAALLGALVRQYLEKKTQSGDSLRDSIHGKGIGRDNNKKNLMEQNDLLRVYTYAIPACVDAKLADFCKDFVTSVVCHDDVIPRLTPTSIRALLKHLLHIRKTWVMAHLEDDITQIADRLKGGWAPRWRKSFTMNAENRRTTSLRKKAKSSKVWVHHTVKHYKNKFHSVSSKIIGSKAIYHNDENGDKLREREGVIEEKIALELHPLGHDQSNSNQDIDIKDNCNKVSMFDGECFYEAAEDENELLEEEEDKYETEKYNTYHSAYEELYNAHQGHEPGQKSRLSKIIEEDDWVPFDEPPMEYDPIPKTSFDIDEKEIDKNRDSHDTDTTTNGDESPDATAPVMLEEMALPRMFIPGKIVHIYTHNGGYNAACVPRTFRELRRISLAGNMLSDHTCKSYYEAMLEVRSIRKAQKPLPQWTGFGEDVTCSCCASPFTWASTSSSEAQEARDKHNCRACGGLICDPCSKNRIPLPQIGLEVPLRVCDRCYFDLGDVLNDESGNSMTMSYIDESECISADTSASTSSTDSTLYDGGKVRDDKSDKRKEINQMSQWSSDNKSRAKVKAYQSKRSAFVDDLADRIKASTMYD